MKKFLLLAMLATLCSAQVCSAQVPPAIETPVMQVLKDYMDAFNRMDMAAWERTYHFPHYRLASGQMRVLERPGLQNVEQLRASLGDGWDHSEWGRLKIVHWSPDKVHVDTLFTRYRKDGSVISSFESIYVVTKEQGRWGVKLRSSMAP